jgi:2'-5' RNA ligase
MLDVPRMANDPQIRLCIWMRTSLFLHANWEIECDSADAKKWIDATVHTCWTRIVPAMLGQYFSWGNSCALPNYNSDDGFLDVTGCRLVTPMSGTPHLWTNGPYNGTFYGIDLANNSSLSDGGSRNVLVRTPFAMWFGGSERKAPLYDESLLSSAYMPWLEKTTRGAALDTRRTYYRRMTVPPIIWRVPRGRLDPSNPNSMTCADYASKLAETLENNSTVIVPDDRVMGIDGRGEAQWEAKSFGAASSPVDVLSYIRELDREIMRAMGIPPEVVEASETGSGYSGRQIPQQALYTITDQLVIAMMDAIDRCILRDLVPHNFGENVRWRLKAVPLAEAIRRREQQGDINPMQNMDATQAAAMVAGINGEQPEEVIEQSQQDGSSGKKTGTGLVPGVGPKGAAYALNPQSGQKYYDAEHKHAVGLSVSPDTPVGCLLVPAPEEIAEAVLAFGRTIPPEELAEGGLESEPHVTVRHGLTSFSGRPLFERLETLGTLTLTLGELNVFSKSDVDVLYVTVENTREWTRWHDALDGMECRDSYPEYIPHMTVAYLRPGMGAKYKGGRQLVNDPIGCHILVYHTPDGRREFKLIMPTEDQLRTSLFDDWAEFSAKDGADTPKDPKVPKPPAPQPRPDNVPKPPESPDVEMGGTSGKVKGFIHRIKTAGHESAKSMLKEEVAGSLDPTHERHERSDPARQIREIHAMSKAYQDHTGSPIVEPWLEDFHKAHGKPGEPKKSPAPKQAPVKQQSTGGTGKADSPEPTTVKPTTVAAPNKASAPVDVSDALEPKAPAKSPGQKTAKTPPQPGPKTSPPPAPTEGGVGVTPPADGGTVPVAPKAPSNPADELEPQVPPKKPKAPAPAPKPKDDGDQGGKLYHPDEFTPMTTDSYGSMRSKRAARDKKIKSLTRQISRLEGIEDAEPQVEALNKQLERHQANQEIEGHPDKPPKFAHMPYHPVTGEYLNPDTPVRVHEGYDMNDKKWAGQNPYTHVGDEEVAGKSLVNPAGPSAKKDASKAEPIAPAKPQQPSESPNSPAAPAPAAPAPAAPAPAAPAPAAPAPAVAKNAPDQKPVVAKPSPAPAGDSKKKAVQTEAEIPKLTAKELDRMGISENPENGPPPRQYTVLDSLLSKAYKGAHEEGLVPFERVKQYGVRFHGANGYDKTGEETRARLHDAFGEMMNQPAKPDGSRETSVHVGDGVQLKLKYVPVAGGKPKLQLYLSKYQGTPGATPIPNAVDLPSDDNGPVSGETTGGFANSDDGSLVGGSVVDLKKADDSVVPLKVAPKSVDSYRTADTPVTPESPESAAPAESVGDKTKVTGPTEPNVESPQEPNDLARIFNGAAEGLTQGLYRKMFDDFVKGKTTEAGGTSPYLESAQKLKKMGGSIPGVDEMKDFVQSVQKIRQGMIDRGVQKGQTDDAGTKQFRELFERFGAKIPDPISPGSDTTKSAEPSAKSEETPVESQEATPVDEPGPSPVPDKLPSEGHQKLYDHLTSTVDDSGATEEQKKIWHDAAKTVVSKIPASQHKQLASSMRNGVVYAKDKSTLIDDIARVLGDDPDQSIGHPKHKSVRELVDHIRSQADSIGGAYIGGRDKFYINGPKIPDPFSEFGVMEDEQDIYAHEISHALDRIYNVGGEKIGRHSDDPEMQSIRAKYWDLAYDDPSKPVGERFPLGSYALTQNDELFAEFGRLLYSGKYDLKRVEEKFPDLSAFFKKRDLWPDHDGRQDPAGFTKEDIFDPAGRIEIGTDGSHVDAFKKDEGGPEESKPVESSAPAKENPEESKSLVEPDSPTDFPNGYHAPDASEETTSADGKSGEIEKAAPATKTVSVSSILPPKPTDPNLVSKWQAMLNAAIDKDTKFRKANPKATPEQRKKHLEDSLVRGTYAEFFKVPEPQKNPDATPDTPLIPAPSEIPQRVLDEYDHLPFSEPKWDPVKGKYVPSLRPKAREDLQDLILEDMKSMGFTGSPNKFASKRFNMLGAMFKRTSTGSSIAAAVIGSGKMSQEQIGEIVFSCLADAMARLKDNYEGFDVADKEQVWKRVKNLAVNQAVKEIQQQTRGKESLVGTVREGEKTATPLETAESKEANPQDEAISQEDLKKVMDAVNQLPNKQSQLITLRLGLDGQGERSWADVAKEVGGSRVDSVSKAGRRAIEQLIDSLTGSDQERLAKVLAKRKD